ncbi:serine hydrolase domain-containing protein [Legionella spiritensis]|uniref:D-alanyl-D-alanine carboxypeptidase n=1 Tax=Legionella spiritensis TaxID=452 RepID=A0A0W0YYA1_LEGSP|nr:serine hydrolase domain-containing protein [Legionella spiritensis]KTD61869.1 D-alanyl-D-alanine carboxypeptidase [Legionella spiritensis]SNV31344.1 D-alanyl-D-alanine carboxypeptidase [Legionella spiritensis]
MIKKVLKYLICSGLFLATFQLHAITSNTVSKPTFSVIAIKKAPDELLANEISYAQYQIVNNTKISRLLTMSPIDGVNQLTGSGLCSNPFLLAPNQSCILNLQLNASLMKSVHSGPVICKTKGGGDNSPSPFLCSQPSFQDQLNVEITPCLPGKCLPNTTTAQLRAITNQFRQQYGIPGIVSGIWVGGSGQLIIEDGFADLSTPRLISRSDHFRIGSITKSFTVTVMLQLIEQELLQLNTPLSQFLPGLQNDNATMEQLADMTSGIFNYTEDPDFVSEFISDLTRVWLPMQLVSIANTNLPYFPAGANWHYSNTNTVILGIIIEMITHNPIANEIIQRILTPLKLSQTFYVNTVPMPEPFAHGYGFAPLEDLTNTSPTSAAASGAMTSRLEDLHVWAIALGKGQLLSPAIQNIRIASLMPIVFSPCADTVPGRGPVNCPEYDKYGMGIGEIQGWIGHTGEFVGYSSLIMYNPQTDSTIVILMNIFGQGRHLPTTLFKEYLTVL